MHHRTTDDHVIVTPGPDGIAYRHRLVALDLVEDASIDFRWCGWSPGVARSIATGQVVDDDVAHATGVGRVELQSGTWRLTQLDQVDLTVLPPGLGGSLPDTR